MSRRKNRRQGRVHHPDHKPGTPPGTLTVDPAAHPPQIRVVAYDSADVDEQELSDVKQLLPLLGKRAVLWVDVDGLGNADVVRQLGEMFGLHPLALEDVMHVHQRPKVDQFGEHCFLVTRMPSRNGQVESEQLSIFLGKNFVLTFQDSLPGDCLDGVRQRIRSGAGRFRQRGPDYLVYSMLDAVVDSHFPLLEKIGDELETLEDVILEAPTAAHMTRLHTIKRDMLAMRRICWPMRDALQVLVRGDMPNVADETRLYLRDCYDHITRIIEWIENYRELCADLKDLYLSALNKRLGEVMKFLTMFTTVFIPLTFICSIYGMNFVGGESSPWNMPELRWYLGYPLVLLLMVVVTVLMFWFFIRKGWLFRKE